VAAYPRTVIGDDLVEYLRRCEKVRDADDYARFNRGMATRCTQLLVTDVDGVRMIDYLGEAFKSNLPEDLASSVFGSAYEYIADQLAYWKARKNTKLVSRYLMLRNYFDRRSPIWLSAADS